MLIETLYWNKKSSIIRLERVIDGGEIAIGTSDTVFGLLAPLTETGKRSLDAIKHRSDKPYLVLVGSKDKLKKLVNDEQLLQVENLAKACWPGPLTLILKAKQEVPTWMKSKTGTIAVRVPNHRGLLSLLQSVPGVFSTSANISGQPIPTNIDEVDKRILEKISVIILDDSKQKEVLPSTILDCTGKQIKLIREGAYPVQALEKECGISILRD